MSMMIGQKPDGSLTPIRVNASGQVIVDLGASEVTVSVDTTGLATSAKQDTGNTSLSSLDGKLPTTTAGADAVANPTLSKLFAFLGAFNGATWDRIRSGAFTIGTTVTGALQSLGLAMYNATPTTRTEGQYGPTQADVNGNLLVGLGSLIEGEDATLHRMKTAGSYSANHITTNTTTPVKSGAGLLRAISINTKGVGNVVTVYDSLSASGTVIAVIDSTLGQATLTFDYAFTIGCTIVTAGGTAPDLTVSYL